MNIFTRNRVCIVVFTLLTIISVPTFPQIRTKVIPSEDKRIKRYVVWISPSNATHIYGLLLNFFPKEVFDNSFLETRLIAGIEIDLNPISLLYSPFAAIDYLNPEGHQPFQVNIDTINFHKFKKVFGLQIGTVNVIEPAVINGCSINLAGFASSKVNGIAISLLINKNHIVNGLTIAAYGNHDNKCRGVQIGCYNSTNDLKGLQIGLWNKNQKRSLPLINWCFKSKENKKHNAATTPNGIEHK